MENVKSNVFLNSIFKIIKGIVISVLITLFMLFIFSIILTYTNVSEGIINPVIIIISGISILIGSILSTLKIKKSGIIYGGIIGITYFFILYLLSGLTGGGFSLTFLGFIFCLVCFICGMIGGIIGINLK